MYVGSEVLRAEPVGPDVVRYVLKLERRLGSSPGQFVMVWVPRVGEVALSVAREEGREIHLLVARKGRVTGFMHDNVREGWRLYVRGPLGRGFAVAKGTALLVGGGVGVAPLIHLCAALKGAGARVVAAIGLRSADYRALAEDLASCADEAHVATEDGSLGIRGTAVDVAEALLSERHFDFVYVCGKEAMMRQVIELAMARGVRVEASLERLVKCGIGVCGACVLEPLGLRVCADGPAFDGDTLTRAGDFGRWWHDAAGRRVPLQP